ncbi:hypothetical protein BD779DRAFT_937299 [Infundibulicybe gibba]|nr:hypothetical protein BD779DRAFT_937299 [Infundibulicybe gibba]
MQPWALLKILVLSLLSITMTSGHRQPDLPESQTRPRPLSSPPLTCDPFLDFVVQLAPGALQPPIVANSHRAGKVPVACPWCTKQMSKASLERHRIFHCHSIHSPWATLRRVAAEARACQRCGKILSRLDALRRHYNRRNPCLPVTMLPAIAGTDTVITVNALLSDQNSSYPSLFNHPRGVNDYWKCEYNPVHQSVLEPYTCSWNV